MQQLFRMRDAEGNDYDVPASDMNEFSAAVPNASRVTRHRDKAGNDYDVPDADMGEFKGAVPDASPLRRMTFADGSTRDFTMPELSKFLRSKEWREGEQFKADREERNAKVAARMGGDGEMHSPTWAAIKGGAIGAAQGAYYGAKSGVGKVVTALPEAAASVGEAAGNLISAGGNAPNAVGEWLRQSGRGMKQWLGENIRGDVYDENGRLVMSGLEKDLGYTDDLVKLGELSGDAAAMAVKFAPAAVAGPAYMETILASDAVNAYRDTFDAATANGFSTLDANLAGAASGLINYFGGKLLMKGDVVANAATKNILARYILGTGWSAAAMGAQKADAKAVENILEGRPVNEGRLEAGKEGLAEGAAFHLLNSVGSGGRAAVAARKETAEMKEMRKQNLLTVAEQEGGGAFLDRIMQSPGLEEVIKARKGGADVSRKMAQKADLPDNMSVAERNEVIDAIIKARGERAAQNAVKVDGFRADALDAAIKEVGGEGEVAQDIRARVIGKLKNARELDDPFRREELVGEAFEEWNKEHPKPTETKPNETRNGANEAPAQPKPPVETRAEGAEAVRPVEGEPPRGEAPRPDVVKPAEKPKEPPQGSQEPPAPPKTGEDTPKPAEGVETPSRASDATGGDAVSSYISGMKPLERSRVTKVLNRRGVYEDGKTAAESISALVGKDAEVRAQHNGKGGVDYIIGDTFGNKTEADFARHVGVKVNEESILRAQEEASLFKTMKKAEQVTRSRGFTGGDFSVPTSDKALQEQIDKLNTIGKYQPEANTRLKALEAVKAERVKRGTWEGGEGVSKPETTTPPSKPVPDGKGKMVKPKAAESDYGVTMFEEPAVDGDGVSYVVKDGPSDAHRMMFKSKVEAETRLAALRAERKAIKESPSATLADGTKVHLLKTDEGWVPYNENYIDLRRGVFNAAKTKAGAIKVAEKGVKWAKDVAEFDSAYKRFEEDFGLDEFNEKVGWGNENGEGWNESAALEHLRRFDLEKLKDMKERAKRFNLGHHNGRNEKIQEWFDKVISEKSPKPDGKGKMVKPKSEESPAPVAHDEKSLRSAADQVQYLNGLANNKKEGFNPDEIRKVASEQARKSKLSETLRGLGVNAPSEEALHDIFKKIGLEPANHDNLSADLRAILSYAADAAKLRKQIGEVTAEIKAERSKGHTTNGIENNRLAPLKKELRRVEDTIKGTVGSANKIISRMSAPTTIPTPDGKGKLAKPKKEKTARREPQDVSALSEAIKEAKTVAKSGENKLFEVKVGTTTVKFLSNEKGIEHAEKMAKTLSTVKDWSPKYPESKTPSAPKPLKVAKGKNLAGFDDISKEYVSKGKNARTGLTKPIVKDGMVYATDGRSIIRMPAEGVADTKDVPDVAKVYPENRKGKVLENFTFNPSESHVGLEQASALTSKDGTVEMWRSPTGEIMFRSREADSAWEPSSTSSFVGSSLKDADLIGSFNPDYLSKAFQTLAKLGVKDAEVEWRGATSALYVKGGDAEILIMPKHSGKVDADTTVQLLGGKRRLTDAGRAAALEEEIKVEQERAKARDPEITQISLDQIAKRYRDNEAKALAKIKETDGKQDPLYSRALDEDVPAKDEKSRFQKIEPITPEQEIEERLDLKRIAPKRRSDPKVLAWAKRNGRTVTNGMATPDAVRAYDEAMTEGVAKIAKRWFPDMKIVAHKYGEKIKRGVHVIEQRLAGTPQQRIRDKAERAVFRSEFSKMVADYAHNNGGEAPKSGGVFTRDAYYIFDIINGEPLGIHRIKINDRNREKITALDKKYKAEIYKGTRDSAYWADRFRNELSEHLQARNGNQVGEGGVEPGDLDSRQAGRNGEVSDARGDNVAGEGEAVSVNYLRDTSGGVLGWFDPKSKEVHLLPGADPRTVAHEIMWHGTRDYISQLAAKGDARAQGFLDMMHDVEKNIPEPLKKKIIAIYTKGTKAPTSDTLMNEFGAWFTMEKGGKALEDAMKSAEGRNWFAKAFYTVKEMYKDFLTRHGRNRVDLSAIDGMTRDEFVDFLAKEFASGKTLGNIKDKTLGELSTEETKLQAYRRKVYDNNAAVRDQERDIEKKTGKKISADDSVEAANALKYGLKEAENIELQRKMSDFLKTLGESGIHYEDLEYYAALKAAAGRDAKIDKRNIDKLTADMKAAGASAQDIADAIANYQSTNGSHIDPREARKMLAEIENGPDAAKYKAAYDKLRAVIEETLDTQVAAGLIDAKDAAQWRAEEPYYVPFKNEYDPESGEWNGRGMSRNFVKPENYMAKGRQSAAGDIIAHVFMDHQQAKQRAIENAVRQKLANLVRANPEIGKVELLRKESVKNIEADDPNVVVFKEGGRAYAIRLNGTRGAAIANAFTQRNLLKMGWADKGFEVFGKKITPRSFAHWSAGMATRYSPTFAIRNTTKDNIELANIVYSERGLVEGTKFMSSYAANRARMAKTLAKYVATGKIDTATAEGQILDRYIRAGGLIAGGVRSEGMDSIKAKLSPESIAKEMKRGKSKIAAAGKHVVNSIAYLNEYAEMATRVGIFSTEVKAGKSDAEAALFSRRATVDFNRHGDWTPGFNLVRLFSNSTLGATARAAAALSKSKYGKYAALAMFGNGLAQAFIEHFYNQDEDERRRKTGEATGKDMSEFDRKTSLFYFRSGDKVYKIAQHESPFSLITYAGNCVGRWLCGDLDGKDVAKNLGVSTAEIAYNFLPMGQINLQSRKGGFVNDLHAAVVSGVCPSVLQPVAELAWNVDFKGDPVLRELSNPHDPKSHNGKEHTPDWAKQSAEWLNDATGGNEGRRGYFDIAPEALQKLVEGYGKNALRDVSAAVSVWEAIANRDLSGLDPRNTPVKRDFVRPLDGNDRRFNDALSAYNADSREYSKMKDAWTPDERTAYKKEHPWVESNSVKDDIAEIRKLRKREQGFWYKNGKAVPHEWTQEELDKIKAKRRKLQAQVLEKMGK